jgi:hypothetical protein
VSDEVPADETGTPDEGDAMGFHAVRLQCVSGQAQAIVSASRQP